MTIRSRLLFDEFELRLDSGELFRDGAPVGLQPQPAKVLELLASRSGEVVSREEIRRLVWGESFVDFDASLNFCIKQIRRALDDSATSPRYIETLPRRGYRFLQPVRTDSSAEDAEVKEAPALEPVTVPPPVRQPRTRYPLPVMLAVAATLITLLILLIASRSQSPVVAAHPRIAVLPLKCGSKDLVGKQICGGITEALTAELTRQLPHGVEIVAPTSLIALQGTGKTPRAIAEEVGANYVLGGAVEPSGGQLKIAAVLSTVDGKGLWSQALNTELSQAPLAYLQIVRGVAETLRIPVSAETKPVHKPSREAYEAYLKGIYLWRQHKMEEAADVLQEAALLDDQFAPAFAYLAIARAELPSEGTAPATVAAARKALKLDPMLAEAHLAMAEVLFKERLDWRRAGEEHRRALALAPGNADVHYSYGKYLVALGRFGEALAEVERARELDPASMAVASDYAWFLYNARRYDEAVRQAKTTLELLNMTQGSLPNVAEYGRMWSYFVKVYGSRKAGNDALMLQTIKERMRELGKGNQVEGIRTVPELVQWRLRFARDLARKGSGNSLMVAISATDAGRPEEALDALELMCRNGGESVMFNYVAVEPMLEPLHGDPRFAKVADCTGIPQDAPARLALNRRAAGAV
jgi:DNA-binding winged helix-turn-helix (wHTH) protein/TolB-like protein